MANANTAAVAVETMEQKIARYEAENKALRAEKKELDASVPNSVTAELSVGNKSQGTMEALPCTFSTGSRGFRGFGKLIISGRRYQVNVQMVEIHSKPTK